jgi:hypothetical protein
MAQACHNGLHAETEEHRGRYLTLDKLAGQS